LIIKTQTLEHQILGCLLRLTDESACKISLQNCISIELVAWFLSLSVWSKVVSINIDGFHLMEFLLESSMYINSKFLH